MENFDQYYRSYKYMQKHLGTDFTANYLTSNMADNDKGEDILSGKLHEKVIDMEWVTAIEDTLPYIEKAIDEQRRFIIENNEVYRIDKAKIINKDSVKHLIQHTNFIDNIDERGKVTPNRVLTIEREDSFETYENRFLITLIENALAFVADKYRKMVDAPTDTFNKVEMERDLVLNNQRVTFKMEYSNEVKDAKAADLDVKDFEKLSDFDRVRRIREKLNSFLNTDMMMALKKCIRVKPPINRTNLMTKNPNYKAGLDLFTYLGAYNKPGYEIIGRDFSGKMDKDVQEAVYISQGFQHFMITIATNPALRRMLEERYQENKTGRGKAGDSELEARVAALEAQVAALTARVAALEQQKAELEAKITELEGVIAEQKAKIAEQERIIVAQRNRINEMEAYVAELEKTKAMLESRVSALEAENAQQKATIQPQEVTIATQLAAIAGLETEIASAKSQISELNGTLEQRDATIAAQTDKIQQLDSSVAQLTADLAAEKQAHTNDIETERAAAKSREEELNKRFDGERAYLENKHKTEREKLAKEHQAAMERLEKQKESEKTKLQKDADNRVKAAQREAGKKAKEQIKAEVGKAQNSVREAAKKASAAAAMYKKELKIDRGVDGLFKYDFTSGALGVQALKAVSFAAAGRDMGSLPNSSKIACLYLVRDSKKVTLYSGQQNKMEVVKNFRGETGFDVCRDAVKEQLEKADKGCAYLSYKSVEKSYVRSFSDFLKKDAQISVTQFFHNKTQRGGKSIIGIYFYRG